MPPTLPVLMMLHSLALTQVPGTLSYQGRLLDSQSAPVTGRVEMIFKLYGVESGGTPLWSEVQSLALTDGYYATTLGAVAALPSNAFDGGSRYLALEIGGAELAPRLPVQSVPYAITCGALAPKLGELESRPAASCAALLGSRPGIASGTYWLKPPNARAAFRAYCDMTTEGGGWTLVWSNLRGGRGKPVTDIQWAAAINTLPLARGEISADLESFQVFTGLTHWMPLAPAGKLRYDWAPNYRGNIDQRAIMSFSLDPAQNYKIQLTDFVQPVGNAQPGLWLAHNGKQFSTYDADHDEHKENCASLYNNSPWWYTACWSGTINGNGETDASHLNGAYWVGSTSSWGVAGGQGAGNGWIYVK